MAPMPVLYVHGNHADESYDLLPPQGVICIDDEVYVHNGLPAGGAGRQLPSTTPVPGSLPKPK